MMEIYKTVICVIISFVAFTGCDTLQQSRIKDEPFVIENTYKYVKPASVDLKPGSIWKGDNGSNNLFGDQRAKGIGDIITVKIVEISQATESATTDTKRSGAVQLGVPNFFGLETNNIPSSISTDKFVKADTKNDFNGSGETTRTGSLSATIAARVVDVMPNGNLAIEGKREISVNKEKKEILFQGIVRPKDIAYDNSILSTQVADVKIIYTGIGVLGEKQSPGWLARIFDLVWPF
ncbi:MAG: flagellar basal body L-ring protein FlgH [Syntrophorhabdaceae bacterium]|nr:flagellar basal body L-ring protein FlgH [Syntrophorhabdaceae bacterium]